MEPSTAANQPLIEGSHFGAAAAAAADIYDDRSLFRRPNCHPATFLLNDRQAAVAATVYTIASFSLSLYYSIFSYIFYFSAI
jgi:hypothetical protein